MSFSSPISLKMLTPIRVCLMILISAAVDAAPAASTIDPVQLAQGPIFSNVTAETPSTLQRICIDQTSSNTASGQQTEVWACGSNVNQNFQYTPISVTSQVTPGVYNMGTIKFSNVNNLCLDVKASGGSGTIVDQFTCNGGKNQNWIYHKADSTIRHSSNNGLCLDVSGGKVFNGAKLIVFTCGRGKKYQQWWFE